MSNVSTLVVTAAAAMLTSSAVAPAQQFLVYQPPTGGDSGLSDLACDLCGGFPSLIAEDFVLSQPATILEILLWGGYYSNQEFTDAFTLEIYVDDLGAPSATPLASDSDLTPVAETTTGNLFQGGAVAEHLFALRFSAPVTLPAGVYWLVIANDSKASSGDFVWEAGDLDATSGVAGSASQADGGPWILRTSDYAFAIPSVIFADGFESGDVSAWSSSLP